MWFSWFKRLENATYVALHILGTGSQYFLPISTKSTSNKPWSSSIEGISKRIIGLGIGCWAHPCPNPNSNSNPLASNVSIVHLCKTALTQISFTRRSTCTQNFISNKRLQIDFEECFSHAQPLWFRKARRNNSLTLVANKSFLPAQKSHKQ